MREAATEPAARRIFPVPPAPAVLDERVIDVSSIDQQHVGNRAPALVLAVGLQCDFPTIDQL